MVDQFSRAELIFGSEGIEKLKTKKVAVFGIGGVGGHACDALARSGIGAFVLTDSDTVNVTNINRQIVATHSTVGRLKTEVMKERMLDINPDVLVEVHNCFFLPENADEFDFASYDYVVDCVDTVSAKVELVLRAQAANVPVICAMGAGNKLDASRFKVADIYKTEGCPLARVMRRELKKRGVKKLKVVYSDEIPTRPTPEAALKNRLAEAEEAGVDPSTLKRDIAGSSAFVPPVVGLIMAGEVVKDLVKG